MKVIINDQFSKVYWHGVTNVSIAYFILLCRSFYGINAIHLKYFNIQFMITSISTKNRNMGY